MLAVSEGHWLDHTLPLLLLEEDTKVNRCALFSVPSEQTEMLSMALHKPNMQVSRERAVYRKKTFSQSSSQSSPEFLTIYTVREIHKSLFKGYRMY